MWKDRASGDCSALTIDHIDNPTELPQPSFQVSASETGEEIFFVCH